jgi:mitogen-activated protein kinase organizer 1
VNVYRSVDGILRTYDIRMGKLVRDNLDSKLVQMILLGPINSFDIGEDKKFIIVSTLSSTIKLVDLSLGEIVSEYKGFHKSD